MTNRIHPTPLALDLAISRACLAAAKAKCNAKITARERAAASEVGEFLARYRETGSGDSTIPSSFVPDDAARELLEQTLAAISIERRYPLVPEDAAESVLDFLKRIAVGDDLFPGEADKLIYHLQRIGDPSEHEEIPQLI